MNQNQLAKLKGKLDNLLDLFLESPFSKDQLTRKQLELETEIRFLNEQTKPLIAKIQLLKNQAWSYEPIYETLEIIKGFETEFTKLERAQIFGDLFPKAILYKTQLVLLSNLKGAPLEVTIPIGPDPYAWHPAKKNHANN